MDQRMGAKTEKEGEVMVQVLLEVEFQEGVLMSQAVVILLLEGVLMPQVVIEVVGME